ncbi:hypothetical protein AK812_SmicGene49088 [Symbiodinium microadriaticum]|uniref:Uncharacterized protein n=1 Tax=Symbiodinium microadriaticum TaxID=2951 RepID=A0A1Q9ETX4_SYMMI|nr:hypothetical protein AK812_SmicGene49088 [Symbiodinium microadriaticum]CAE7624606.1 unnamed protein product [Symbiodinium sp. KB8]
MGCGGSCIKLEPASVASFHMTAPKVVPAGVPLQPDREDHDAYVRKLNVCLKKVQRHPNSFLKKVEARRAEWFDAFDAIAPEELHPVPQRPSLEVGGRTRTF